MSSYRLNPEHYNKIFALPALVVDRYLSSVCGYYLKVLIYLYRHADSSFPTTGKIAKALELSPADVREALDFWQKENVIVDDEKNLVQPELEHTTEDAAKPQDTKSNVTVITNRPPVLSSGEIAERINRNNDLKFVFETAENFFGRPLTITEQRSVIAMCEWMGLPVDVVLMIFEYCKAMNKKSIRYIETVASNWCDLEITTHERAEEFIARSLRFNEQQKEVRECCGIYDRNLTSKELKFIELWYNDYRFDINMISYAYETTINNIGKLNFTYMDKILKQLHEEGVTDPKNAEEIRNGSPSKAAKQDTSYDLNALDRIGLEVPEL